MPSAFANVAASQTDSSIVAARSGMKVRVYSFSLSVGATATAITFNTKPGGAGAAISPAYTLGANGIADLSYNPKGWLETVKGQGLTVTTGAGSTTGVLVVYDYLP